ncbi:MULTISPECIES: hypothetical protein [unclassified Bradyrhizobium]|uniref:hypothetical protein n=1 Tax=unclassified Bradyrhizobium TaxID=2631580 RepID=UPI001FF9B3A5|nr:MULTISPECIES: hypothetical protein [unclassified Bradyrhizobium]MCK1270826.1 hypothetical protein [Bradyrhizobium sp. 84]MCK1372133.1 hypothetical protein [Bradyrhizobium sp. 49]MCK1430666.1 hypothetical protein [Bradyrhizobium sp. 87]
MARKSKSAKTMKVRRDAAGKKRAGSKAQAAAPKRSVAPGRKRLFGLAGRTNRAIFDECTGTHWPRDRKLDPPYSRYALAGLAAQIKQAGVPVQTAQVQMCDTVGCVLDLMKKANPGGL